MTFAWDETDNSVAILLGTDLQHAQDSHEQCEGAAIPWSDIVGRVVKATRWDKNDPRVNRLAACIAVWLEDYGNYCQHCR